MDPTRPLRYAHPISFKLDDDQIERALALRSTFPTNTWAEAFRWLIDDDQVADVIARRVRGS
jgi:hypothetical protein